MMLSKIVQEPETRKHTGHSTYIKLESREN